MPNMSFATPKWVAYNPEDKVLSLHFRTGGTHHFANVPVEHYHGLQTAESTGKYYHAKIKGKFEAAK